jgi:hypothetical protein
VFIDCTGPECPARIIGEVRQPAILDWSREHPVTAYLDLSTVRLAKARRVEALTWGDVVVEAEDTPLVIAGEKGDSRSVFIGFDLGESNLPLRVAFPILVSNLVNWLTARQSGQGLQSVRTGEPVTVQLDGDALRATFEGPGRRRETFDVTQNPLILTDLDRVGTYTLRAGEETHHFAASLLSAAESDLTPRDRLTFGPQRVAAAQKGTTRNREFWRYLALLGLVVLAGEWWLYHRRG